MNEPSDLNAAWDLFCKNECCDIRLHVDENKIAKKNMPVCSDLYISTKTIICYLNKDIDINTMFWNIPILPYYSAENGVIKKEIKLTSNNSIELDNILKNLENIDNVNMHVITNINNKNGRIKFKDVRKISIGLSKKDILTTRAKKKAYISFSMNRFYQGDWIDSMASRFVDELPEEFIEKNSFFDESMDENDFDFNQDLDTDDNIRSPGWIRYQKRIK